LLQDGGHANLWRLIQPLLKEEINYWLSVGPESEEVRVAAVIGRLSPEEVPRLSSSTG
jgi:hypothetical protein